MIIGDFYQVPMISIIGRLGISTIIHNLSKVVTSFLVIDVGFDILPRLLCLQNLKRSIKPKINDDFWIIIKVI